MEIKDISIHSDFNFQPWLEAMVGNYHKAKNYNPTFLQQGEQGLGVISTHGLMYFQPWLKGHSFQPRLDIWPWLEINPEYLEIFIHSLGDLYQYHISNGHRQVPVLREFRITRVFQSPKMRVMRGPTVICKCVWFLKKNQACTIKRLLY